MGTPSPPNKNKRDPSILQYMVLVLKIGRRTPSSKRYSGIASNRLVWASGLVWASLR